MLVKDKTSYEGFHTNPMRWDTVRAKFDGLCEPYADAALRDEVADAVRDLESVPVEDLEGRNPGGLSYGTGPPTGTADSTEPATVQGSVGLVQESDADAERAFGTVRTGRPNHDFLVTRGFRVGTGE